MITVRVAVAVGCLALLCIMVVHQKGRAIGANSAANAEALEREIRIGLPLGSSLSTVEDFLRKRGIEFSFEGSSKSVYAVARKLKGSTTLTSKCLTLQFYFDDASKLKSIDAKVQYTGP
jgi:hypothetical protein